ASCVHVMPASTASATSDTHSLSLHDALPISFGAQSIAQALHYCGAHRIGHGTRLKEDPDLMRYVRDHRVPLEMCLTSNIQTRARSEEHTSELQSRRDLVCRLLLEKKKKGHVRVSSARRSRRRPPATKARTSAQPRSASSWTTRAHHSRARGHEHTPECRSDRASQV